MDRSRSGRGATARQAVARILRDPADRHTRPDRPRGCMLLCAADDTNHNDIAGQLKQLRDHDLAVNQRRIQADIDAGVLRQGISQSTRDGASREVLERVAELAIKAWPPSSGRQPAR